MTGVEWWALVIGGGGLASIVSVWLTHRRDKDRVEIDWYDRAVSEVKRLEDQLDALKTENKSLRSFNEELRQENGELRDNLNGSEEYQRALELIIRELKNPEEE